LSHTHIASSHAEVATQYARDVVSGKIPNCKWIILACKTHLINLKRQHEHDYPYRFDVTKANKPVQFIELLPHVEGKWAATGKRLLLEPWQKFLVCSLFGWVKKSDGFRQYKRVYCCVPRKSGKSSLAAGISLYCLIMDGEIGAQVYSGANSLKQASFIFNPARQMAEKTPRLKSHYGVEVNADSITVLKTNSKFSRLIGNPGDGSSPSLCVADELHESEDSRLYDAMSSGMGAREQPILFAITTAGFNTAGPCYLLQKDFEKVLEGSVDDPTKFGLIYTIDTEPYTDCNGVDQPGDDWTTIEALQKANPNWGVSVNIEDALAEQQEAIRSSEKQNLFKTKKLNIWCFARTGFFNTQKWMECADPTLNIEDFAGQDCVKGLDLASQEDLTADITIFQKTHPDDGKLHYYLFGRFYVPAGAAEKPTNQHYQKWVHDGDLIKTDGDEIDYAVVRTNILADIANYNVRELCVDPYQSTLMKQEIVAETGVEIGIVTQNAPTLTIPMKWLRAMISSGRIHHDGNPVMTWCISNVIAREDGGENVFPRKERPENKIDGVSATLCVLARIRAVLGEETDDYVYSGF
jgi:phage terminase large subunit-like protein